MLTYFQPGDAPVFTAEFPIVGAARGSYSDRGLLLLQIGMNIGMDGVFNPQGKIKTLPIVAGYAAYQHWWTDKTRSSFLVSGVRVDNYSFQPDHSYYKTERISGNITYSPVPRFDLGVELIWGRRTNEDRKRGDAIQALLVGQFRF